MIMKKVMILLAAAAILTSCGNGELENVWSEYQEVSVDDKEKKDPNFLFFKDRTQSGKESK